MKNNIIFTIFLFLFSLSFYAQDTGFGDLSDSETDTADSGFGDLSSIEAPDNESSSFGESGSQATEESARPLFWVYYPHAREILKKGRVFNERNSSVSKSFDDLINARRFRWKCSSR